MKKSILKSISDYIKSRKDHFTSENIETNKIPVFLVYTAMSNDRENLNLYFDYKTSKQYINRAIFSLGEYEDFSEQDKKEIIKTAVLALKKLGIKAHPTKSDYQGVGYKKNPVSLEKFKADWIKEPLSEEDFKTLTDYYSNKFVAAKIRWFDEKSGEGFVRLSEGPLKGFSVFVHGSAFGGDKNFGQKTAFKAPNDLPVLVKLILDWNYIQVHRMKEDKGIKKNPESKSGCIFKTPDQMREFLNKHLKDRWHWKRNKIVIHVGQGNWKIARNVEDFFKLSGFTGASSELDDKTGNVYVSAFVPRAIMQLHEKE